MPVQAVTTAMLHCGLVLGELQDLQKDCMALGGRIQLLLLLPALLTVPLSFLCLLCDCSLRRHACSRAAIWYLEPFVFWLCAGQWMVLRDMPLRL